MVPSLDEIIGLIRIQLGIERVNARDLFVEDLGAESMDLLNLVALTEDTYRIALEEEKIVKVRSVMEFYELVRASMVAP